MKISYNIAGSVLLVGISGAALAYSMFNAYELQTLLGDTEIDIKNGNIFDILKSIPRQGLTLNAEARTVSNIKTSRQKPVENWNKFLSNFNNFQKTKKCNYYFSFDGKNNEKLDSTKLNDQEKKTAVIMLQKNMSTKIGRCISGRNVIFSKDQKNNNIWYYSYTSN